MLACRKAIPGHIPGSLDLTVTLTAILSASSDNIRYVKMGKMTMVEISMRFSFMVLRGAYSGTRRAYNASMDETKDSYVSRDEAARLLGITPPQVSRLLKRGLLQGLPPTDWQISLASIELAKATPRIGGWRKGRARKSLNDITTEQS